MCICFKDCPKQFKTKKNLPLNKHYDKLQRRLLLTLLLLYGGMVAIASGRRMEEENFAAGQQESALPNMNVIVDPSNNNNGLTTTTTTETANPTNATTSNVETTPDFCFTMEENMCLNFFNNTAPTANTCMCRQYPNSNSTHNNWYCCNITQLTMVSSCPNYSNWTNLHIYNMTMPEIDLSLSIFQTLQSLAITDGNIVNITKKFSRMNKVKCLNLSNNNLSNVTMKASIQLKFLNLSNNNLTEIPQITPNHNITLDIRQNKRMLCNNLMATIFRGSFKFVSPNSTYCLLDSAFNWFNSTDYIAISQLDIIRRFYTDCPVIQGKGNCTCNPEHMLSAGDPSKNKIFCRVDCSNLGLTELPPKLPENTFQLNITNNNITVIGDHFHNNPTYQSIVKLFADNNHIESMHDLEGTQFMDHFQKLYLRNNHLKRLPEYLLTNVLDSNVGRVIFLGGNKLMCDCNSAKVLKLWLLKRSRDIPDYNEILCRNMPQRIMELQELKVCQSPHDWTDYVYYLIATEVILLVALITKVSYDYWVFKTAGYLPWPASKMPKLPCDWLCES
ncbi:leucine-rich repeat domain-containing protein hfw isoform X1 [Musca autumnalis]|uniref:leucine-rich repeat domain-containing protein hfw isoform X1 n=1 Tax=Musca autumnalis TaxID=221902 RepID=UPI003CE90DC9